MIIYKTTNMINNKIYIGKDSKNNKNYYGSGKILKLAIKKYGKENFKKEILEECINQKELIEKEIYWIKKLNSYYPNGYNIAKGGLGGDVYTNMPDNMRKQAGKKISKSNKGKIRSSETKKKISLKNSNKIFSKEHRQKLSESHKGQTVNSEIRKKISNSLKGRPCPTKGRKHSTETKRKISESNMGHYVSEETKKKISLANGVKRPERCGVNHTNYIKFNQKIINLICSIYKNNSIRDTKLKLEEKNINISMSVLIRIVKEQNIYRDIRNKLK